MLNKCERWLRTTTQIHLSIYSLSIGIYHTCIVLGLKHEVHFFADDGLVILTRLHPLQSARDDLKQVAQISIGLIDKSESQLLQELKNLAKNEFNSASYHPLNKNCNDFTKFFLGTYFPEYRYPYYLNVTPKALSLVTSLLPRAKAVLIDAVLK